MNVTDKIKELIKLKDVKKKDLAEFLGVTPQRLNNWFLRKNIPTEFLPKVAEYLGVSTDYLLGNDSNTIIAHNSHIIHNSPNSKISINEAIESLPHEVGVIVKYMMEFDEKERLKLMRCFFKNCEGDKK